MDDELTAKLAIWDWISCVRRQSREEIYSCVKATNDYYSLCHKEPYVWRFVERMNQVELQSRIHSISQINLQNT